MLILIYLFIIKSDDIKILYRIIREIYLINDLKAYILIENNIIEFE